jgi:hypothetical protein
VLNSEESWEVLSITVGLVMGFRAVRERRENGVVPNFYLAMMYQCW